MYIKWLTAASAENRSLLLHVQDTKIENEYEISFILHYLCSDFLKIVLTFFLIIKRKLYSKFHYSNVPTYDFFKYAILFYNSSHILYEKLCLV